MTMLHTINEVLAFFTGFFFNVALLYLIQRRTPSLMRSYATILRIHAISDLLADIVNFATSTHCIALKGRFYFMNGGFHSSYWTPKMAFLSVETYLWIVVYAPLGLVPLDFYYRLRAVCHGDLISKRLIGLWVLLAYIISFIVAFPINGLYMTLGPTNATKNYDPILADALDVPHENLHGYLTMGLRAPLEVAVLVSIVLVINLDYTFIAYVVWQIYKKMKENVNRNVSKKAEATQRQVSKIMFVQASIPLVLCIPTSLNITSALFLIDVPYFAPFVFSIICWLVALKPLATICIVPHYRNTLFQMGSISSSGSTIAIDHKTPSRMERRLSSVAPISLAQEQNREAIYPNY